MANHRMYIHTILISYEKMEGLLTSPVALATMGTKVPDDAVFIKETRTHRVVSEQAADAELVTVGSYRKWGIGVRNIEVVSIESHPIDSIIHIDIREAGFARLFNSQ